jgi:hypothetical protein
MGNQGLLDALRQVKQQADTSGWTPELEQEYNRINNQQYEIRKKVESKIQHLCMGAVKWSPKLQSFRTAIEIWSLLLKKRKGTRQISNSKLRCLLSSSTITGAFSKSIPEIEEALSQAYADYKEARLQAVPWREEFMATLAASRAEVKGTKKETELNQLRSIEQQKRIARNIKRMQGKLHRNATLRITVNDRDRKRVLTDQHEMEEACITKNLSRFLQSEGTPPMVEPLLSDLGYLADTPKAQAILNGTYNPPPSVDYYARLFLRELYMPDNVRAQPMTDVDVTPQSNRSAWKKQKEPVLSDPNGLTYSHYKTGATDDEINSFDAALWGLPYRYSFSLDHWQAITDVEILKKAGVYDIGKM